VDEGGAGIGVWRQRATPEAEAELLDAVSRIGIWRFPAEPIEPGEAETTWSYNFAGFRGAFHGPEASLVREAIAPVEVIMRRLVYWMQSGAAEGIESASLHCELVTSDGIQMYVENHGTHLAAISNPFLHFGSWDDTTYARVEWAPPPTESSGFELAYQALPMTLQPVEARWSEPTFLLYPGERLLAPIRCAPPTRLGGFLRAVFSNYAQPVVQKSQATAPVALRGRVFSAEIEL